MSAQQHPAPAEREQLRALAGDIYPRLLRFFRSKVPHPDCHDLAQQTFVEFLKQVQSKPIDDRRAYMFGIARFQLLKFIERRSRAGAPFDSARLSMAAVGTSLSMHFDRRNRLMGALRELPVEHQIAFELRHGEEMQLEEVAKAMDVSLATVKRYLASAKAALQAHLRAGDDPSDSIADAYRSN